METTNRSATLYFPFQLIDAMPLPPLLTAAMLILSLAGPLAWGKPPVPPPKGNIAHTNSVQQRGEETISGFLPSASGMEANLASTFCSGLWTQSTHECFFSPDPQLKIQPSVGSRSGKQFTQAGKLKGQSHRKTRGKDRLTKSGKLGVLLADHSSESESDNTTGSSDFLQPLPFGSGKTRPFNQAQDPCQQCPGKQIEIMKGNLAGQLTTPLPQYKCQYCARTCKSKGGLTTHKIKCKSKPRITLQCGPSPTTSSLVLPSSPDNADPDRELLLDEEPALTLAECSRQVSAYIKHPEWLNFLNSGRHATTQTTVVNGWNGLSLDTVCPADKETPFPALTPVALERLMQLSPSISRLYRQLQKGINPLADIDDLKAFLNKTDQNSNELFAGGSHSLVIKWHRGPGYVFKIARSEQDHIRLHREKSLYLWLRDPDKVLLNLTTTPMRSAFSVHGKPILALRQVDGTARDRLRLMREHSLNERLDFALSVISHFCQMYRRFLEKDVLLADRHDDNIGFNEIPLQGRKSMGLDDATIQVPVMLDLDPYWFGDQELRLIQLHLPTWVPVVIGLLEEVFTPVSSHSQIRKIRVEVIDQLRQLASPVFTPSSSADLLKPDKADRESALQSCIYHWFQDIKPEYGELLAEARSHIEPLLTRLNQWDSTPRVVAEWNKKLQEEMGQILQWLNSWKNESEFSLLKDFTDEGIIRIPGSRGGTSPQDQEILTLLSMIHGKLGCHMCSRTFATNTEYRKHRQLHQQKKLQHCEICDGDFTALAHHKRIHTGERPYKCKHCSKSFAQAGTLNKHLRIHTGDRPYQCDYCSKTFSQSYILQIHLLTHTGDKPYKCEYCGKCCSQKIQLQTHLRSHTGDKPCRSEHCDKVFPVSGELKKHLQVHSGDKPYPCEYCGKGFSTSSHLKRHLRVHSGERPYQCQHCGKVFSDRDQLKRHLRVHSGEKPYQCRHCGRGFSVSCNLKVHLRTHSGEKPYKCEHCCRYFSQNGNLRKHLRTHSGDKPYKCQHCSKCFSQSGNLREHLRTHSGEKPHKCKNCGRSFSDASNKNRHQKGCRIEQS